MTGAKIEFKPNRTTTKLQHKAYTKNQTHTEKIKSNKTKTRLYAIRPAQ